MDMTIDKGRQRQQVVKINDISPSGQILNLHETTTANSQIDDAAVRKLHIPEEPVGQCPSPFPASIPRGL
jgi:hypothetical protein